MLLAQLLAVIGQNAHLRGIVRFTGILGTVVRADHADRDGHDYIDDALRAGARGT